MPTVQGQLAANRSVSHAAFVIAAWAIYSLGVNEKKESINIKDALQEVLFAQATLAQTNPVAFIQIEAVFGTLSTSAAFVAGYTKAYNDIVAYGVEKCIIELNSNS